MRAVRNSVWMAAALAFVIGLGTSASAQEKKFKLSDDAKKTDVDELAPLKKDKEKPAADPFVVPEGSNEVLLKYIEKLQQTAPPQGADQEAMKEFIGKLLGAMLKAADKILSNKPTAADAEKAVSVKIGALNMMGQLGDKEAAAKVDAMPAELEKLNLADLAAKVKGMLVQRRVMQAAQGNKPDEFKTALAEYKKLLAGRKLGRGDVGAMLNICLAAERIDQKLAVATYTEFGKLLSTNEDKTVAGLGAQLAGAANRLELVGKPFQVDGVGLDGKPLDWSQFKGKVVLVNFWATWCGPCRKEIPELIKFYKGYQKKGFEVVAVSVDQKREDLDAFLADTKLPWPIVVDQAGKKEGDDKSMSTRWGVMAIPELILVGKDGNVVARGTGGLDLEKELTALLGPADPVAKEAKEAKPAGKLLEVPSLE